MSCLEVSCELYSLGIALATHMTTKLRLGSNVIGPHVLLPGTHRLAYNTQTRQVSYAFSHTLLHSFYSNHLQKQCILGAHNDIGVPNSKTRQLTKSSPFFICGMC